MHKICRKSKYMRYIKVFLLIKTSMTNLIFTKIVSNGGFHLHRPFGLNYLPFHTGILSSFLVQIINRHYLTAHPQGCQGCQKNQKDLRFHTVHYKKEKCSFCLYLFWVKVKDQKKNQNERTWLLSYVSVHNMFDIQSEV